MYYDRVKKAADYISERIPFVPKTGVILGSGLGNFSNAVKNGVVIPYADIPGFPVSGVKGHEGNLIVGEICGKKSAILQGRVHYYEGFSMKDVAFPVFVLKLLGVEELVITNAAGGVNKCFKPGDLMLITDFINTAGDNPLIGENDERFGPRFPDMSVPFSDDLIKLTKEAAKQADIDLKEGVYLLTSGPCFETAAEIRAFALMGADAVGMSTVPEIIAANYLSMKVLGISCITNMATGIAIKKHSHEEVLKVANECGDNLTKLILGIFSK